MNNSFENRSLLNVLENNAIVGDKLPRREFHLDNEKKLTSPSFIIEMGIFVVLGDHVSPDKMKKPIIIAQLFNPC